MKEGNSSDIEDTSPCSNDAKEGSPKKHNNKRLLCLQNKQSCLKFIESTPATSFMTIVTIYALYSDDIQVLGFDKSTDNIFMIMSSISFFLFLLEIGIQCWCRENYLTIPNVRAFFYNIYSGQDLKSKWKSFCSFISFGSFYFWLDLLATLTMLFELPWMIPVMENGGIDNNFENARAGKASRAGAKAARILRVVRMIRLFRLVKLYKYFVGNKNKKDGSASIFPDHEEKALLNMPPESHVGAEMSDRTTKKVIIGILIMLIVIPLLQVEKLEYFNEYGMQIVLQQRARASSATNQDTINWEYTESLFVNTTNCIHMIYGGFDDGKRAIGIIPAGRSNPQQLRSKEKRIISIRPEENSNLSLMAIFDVKQRSNEEAVFNVLLTSFVVILLAVGTMTFSRDVNKLVILPIEKMVQMVREISANPLGNTCSLSLNDLMGTDDGMETTLLLKTISKIASLMRVGFGEAGAEIIGRNLNMCSDRNGCNTISLVGNGTKILSIFAFCDVRNFTDTTECLQEEVMLFVNRIAHILHSVVVQCDGAANKNIGDAFLLTWKLNPGKTAGHCEDHGYAGDKALYSMLKTMIEMIRHKDFICNFSPSALGALYARMPGYKCQIGCGLHFGWAIEGAIGSDKKIDASYISPHVNFSEFLESSTKLYGVPILLSDPFFKLLSPSVAKYCRKVDNILKSGDTDEISAIYTYDANLDIKFEKEIMGILSHDTFLQINEAQQIQRSKYASANRLQGTHSQIAKFRVSLPL